MMTVLIGVGGALAGTIVGALLTQFLQRRNAAFAKVHEARIDAYRQFAAVVMDYRSALMDRWFYEHSGRRATEAENVYTLRSAVWAAYFQVVLVAGDPQIAVCAAQARESAHALKRATTREELSAGDKASRTAVGCFADVARHEVSALRPGRRA
ncbi:MAG TPA: hypothetical protein VLL08_26225 [Kineosporiaceae bacterium]|nr:hypothetical protein [Kineosporiaceae bacterium]